MIRAPNWALEGERRLVQEVGVDGHPGRTVGGDPASELDEATDVEGEVGHADLRAGSGETDRADDQSHDLLLHREHVLDPSAVA